MKLLFLLPHPIESPGPRFCVYQYLQNFKDAGIDYTISTFLNSYEYENIYNKKNILLVKKIIILIAAFIKGTLKQLLATLTAKNYDGVIVYRETITWGGAWIEKYISKKGIPLIHIYDDAIWLPVKSQIGINPFLKKLIKSENKFDEITKVSTHVIVVNRYLANHANMFNKHVNIIPIVVNDHFLNSVMEKKKTKDIIAIGWVGSGSTAPYLHLLDNIWEKLPKNCELRIVGGEYMPKGIKTINIKWSLETELHEFAMIDIGIVPMPDNEWVKGKGGGKTLQYMSMNIPTIGSAVGINTEIIQDGVNGSLAKDDKEWVDKLTMLIENPELRLKLGREGRRTVEEKYSVKVWAPRYVEILRNVVEG